MYLLHYLLQLNVAPVQSAAAPGGHVYMKMFGNEIRYIPFDATFVNTLIRSGKIIFTSKVFGLSEVMLSFNTDAEDCVRLDYLYSKEVRLSLLRNYKTVITSEW